MENVSNAEERTEDEGQNCLEYVGYIGANTREVGVAGSPSKGADVWAGGNEGGDIQVIHIGFGEYIVDGGRRGDEGARSICHRAVIARYDCGDNIEQQI